MVIAVSDLSTDQVERIFATARAFQANPTAFRDRMQGKILALLFFEPSTRTYFSFAAAMQRLGGSILGFNGGQGTSLEKGESLEDTVRMMASYADGMAIRHKDVGLCRSLQKLIDKPIINAGEGTGEHPTQALIDLFTLQQHYGRLDGLTLGLLGDLKHSRAIHSLVRLGSRFGVKFKGYAPPGFALPEEEYALITTNGSHYDSFVTFPPQKQNLLDLDALYINRLQKERLGVNHPPADYFDVPLVTLKFAENLPKNCVILDPLPRINTTDPAFDSDPRAIYFFQAAQAVAIRAAIIIKNLP